MIIIKIVESLEKSVLLIDGVTETVKQKIKKQEDGFFGAMVVPRILESLTGCRTMFHFAVFCKIGALERNAY